MTKTTILTIMMLTAMILLDCCSFGYGFTAMGDLSTLAFVSSRHVGCLGGRGRVGSGQGNVDGRIIGRLRHNSIFGLERNRMKSGLVPYKGAMFECSLYKVRIPIVRKMAMMEEDDDFQDDRESEKNSNEHNDSEGEEVGDGSDNIGEGELDSPSVVLDDLSWRVEKLRLEEANTRRFLKSGPRFLPYEECRKWVQAWSRWDTEQDWKDWIDEGEKRNSYIPARPDEYYGRLGVWRGWDHFLGNICDDDHDDDRDDDIGDVSDGMDSSSHFE